MVLTVTEGHVLYPSCWTAGRSAHDPRRQHTRFSPARHGAGTRAGQRRPRLPRVWDLSHALLPLAEPILAVRARWIASPPTRGPSGTPLAAQPAGRADDPGLGTGLADLGAGSVVQPAVSTRARRPAGNSPPDLPGAAAGRWRKP